MRPVWRVRPTSSAISGRVPFAEPTSPACKQRSVNRNLDDTRVQQLPVPSSCTGTGRLLNACEFCCDLLFGRVCGCLEEPFGHALFEIRTNRFRSLKSTHRKKQQMQIRRSCHSTMRKHSFTAASIITPLAHSLFRRKMVTSEHDIRFCQVFRIVLMRS